MSRWRAAAIERLPALIRTIERSNSVMALWTELRFEFIRAYREPRNDALIARIYSFADWCESAPRNEDASHDPLTAVMVGFYEHIPEIREAREDMPKWFPYDVVAKSPKLFSYQIGEQGYRELLQFMAKHRNRYIERPRQREENGGTT